MRSVRRETYCMPGHHSHWFFASQILFVCPRGRVAAAVGGFSSGVCRESLRNADSFLMIPNRKTAGSVNGLV